MSASGSAERRLQSSITPIASLLDPDRHVHDGPDPGRSRVLEQPVLGTVDRRQAGRALTGAGRAELCGAWARAGPATSASQGRAATARVRSTCRRNRTTGAALPDTMRRPRPTRHGSRANGDHSPARSANPTPRRAPRRPRAGRFDSLVCPAVSRYAGVRRRGRIVGRCPEGRHVLALSGEFGERRRRLLLGVGDGRECLGSPVALGVERTSARIALDLSRSSASRTTAEDWN